MALHRSDRPSTLSSSVGDIAPAEQRARAHTVHVSSPHVGFPPSRMARTELSPGSACCHSAPLAAQAADQADDEEHPLSPAKAQPHHPQAGSPASRISAGVPTVEPSSARSEAVIGTGPAASARTSTRDGRLCCAPHGERHRGVEDDHPGVLGGWRTRRASANLGVKVVGDDDLHGALLWRGRVQRSGQDPDPGGHGGHRREGRREGCRGRRWTRAISPTGPGRAVVHRRRALWLPPWSAPSTGASRSTSGRYGTASGRGERLSGQ